MTSTERLDTLDQRSFPGFGDDSPLDVSALQSAESAGQLARRLRDGSWTAFAETAAGVGYCSRPVRLVGSSATVDRATGEVRSTFHSADAPLGMLYRRCGNRREQVCPSCSRLYARDTFEMIRAGVQGGKQVTEQVADNPLLFVTLTAPSFGLIHGTRAGRGSCRPRRRDDRTRCPHGRPTWCHATHEAADDQVGTPMCSRCYDYETHVLWQWWAPELWRRFTIEVRRNLAAHYGMREGRLNDVASVQYAKVAEGQARGVIHFDALIRLDGRSEGGIGSPASGIDAAELVEVVQQAASKVSYLAPSAYETDPGRVLRFGAQVDIRVVRHGSRIDDPNGPLTPGQVAGYLAKYATKDTNDAASRSRIGSIHRGRIKAVCHDLHRSSIERELRLRRADPAYDDPYRLLGKWSHMLGFRGHFSTKSRRYSVTLGALRRARVRWQAIAAESRRTGEPIDTADLEARLLADDEDETTLVIGSWAYAGSGVGKQRQMPLWPLLRLRVLASTTSGGQNSMGGKSNRPTQE